MPSLNDIVNEFESALNDSRERRAARATKVAKATADQLRIQKLTDRSLTPEQIAALDAEIARLDPQG